MSVYRLKTAIYEISQHCDEIGAGCILTKGCDHSLRSDGTIVANKQQLFFTHSSLNTVEISRAGAQKHKKAGKQEKGFSHLQLSLLSLLASMARRLAESGSDRTPPIVSACLQALRLCWTPSRQRRQTCVQMCGEGALGPFSGSPPPSPVVANSVKTTWMRARLVGVRAWLSTRYWNNSPSQNLSTRQHCCLLKELSSCYHMLT